MTQTLLLAACIIGASGFMPAIPNAPQGAFTRLAPRATGACVRRPLNGLQMASTSDFKTGLTIEFDGTVYKILEFLHVKPGKGSAFVRSKLKNLLSGNTVEKTFRAGESITTAQVEKLELQFTYVEGEEHCFMDTTSYEEQRIPSSLMGDKSMWIKEGMTIECLQWNDKVIDIMIPKTMVLEVTATDPGAKGNTAQGGGQKPATLETGAVINVPNFIVQGEKIKVDTEDRKYLSRASE